MNQDRELLEWAAKAAGVHWNQLEGYAWEFSPGLTISGRRIWNPLTDDGDALRLAVKLGIVCSAGLHPKYVHDDDTMQAWASPDDMLTTIYEGEEWSRQSGDPYAATRRAIVRAAASIGQSQENQK